MTPLYDEHADLYDIAFSWDVSHEAAWLVERLGPGCTDVLEPGCGSGRMLEALARCGLVVTGIDSSAAMVEIARRRLATTGLPGDAVEADMTDFDLGRTFDGAICPVNTLRHLSRPAMAAHLQAMRRALVPGARYLIQLGLHGAAEGEASMWEADRDGTHLRMTWTPERVDTELGIEIHRSRVEVLAGPRAGEVYEDLHEMTVWGHAEWADAVAAAGFEWAALYDGAAPDRPRVDFDATGGLLWHELARP